MNYLKQPKFRNKRYLRWVAGLPSCISGRPADDAHHIKRPGFGGTTKCSDLFTIPLTRDEHDSFHTIGWQSWEDLHGDQRQFVMETLERAVREEILVAVL